MKNRTEILIPEATYHVYNRANGWEKIFKSAENYRFFLAKYQLYVSPIADTFCYCLMPNHFHFLIRVKKEEDLRSFFESKQEGSATLQGFKTLEGLARQEALSKLLSQQFSHLFNAYTQAFNKHHKRKGSLLMHPYNRIRVNEQSYLFNLVPYIHHNPLEASLCSDLSTWDYSSYRPILQQDNSFINATEVIGWYSNLDNFKYMHNTFPREDGNNPL